MNAKNKNIDNKNIFYKILKNYIWFCLAKIFYRRYNVVCDEKIPNNVPVVYGMNHQNALIDALVVLCATKRDPVFFARADIFKKKTLSKILRFLKIAPIFRNRDGRDTLQNNSDSFDIAVNVLSRNHTVGIFPEGTHNNKEHIIPLKKGMARMVLQAEDLHDFNLNVHVYPVGLGYVDYIKPRSEVFIHFGKPLTFGHLKDLYRENKAQALVKFNEEFDAALKNIAIHVEDEQNYVLIQNIRKTYIFSSLGKGTRLKDSFKISRFFIDKINGTLKNEPEKVKPLFDIAKEYYSQIENYGITEPILSKGILNTFAALLLGVFLLIGSPFCIAGRVLNYMPIMFFYKYFNKKIKDPQFRSSVYFAFTIFVSPFIYILQAAIVGILTSSFIWALISIPSMMILGILAYQYLRVWKWTMFSLKANFFIIHHKLDAAYLKELRSKMLNKLNEFLQN